MDRFWDWVSGFGTIGGMAYFFTGYFVSFLMYWLWCRHKHRTMVINWRYVGVAVSFIVVGFVSIQSQTSYSIAKATAQEVQRCQNEFQIAIKASRELSSINDALSVQQRDLLAAKDRAETMMWLRLLDPPEPIASMENNDPRREAYGIAVVREYATAAQTIDNFVADITKRQVIIANSRPPLPEPSCGKL